MFVTAARFSLTQPHLLWYTLSCTRGLVKFILNGEVEIPLLCRNDFTKLVREELENRSFIPFCKSLES